MCGLSDRGFTCSALEKQSFLFSSSKNPMKRFKKYWWLLILIVVAPIIINYALLIPAFGPIVGDNVHWLSFWGSYLAALIPALGAFIILFIQREDNHKENERNRQLQVDVLKYQQEMQWLNEKKDILIDFALALSKDDLIGLSNKIGEGKDILQDVKTLMRNLVKNDSRVGFMNVPEKTEAYKQFNDERHRAFYAHRDAILDLQEINILFMRTPLIQRHMTLQARLQQGLIHKGLQEVIATYPNEAAFIQANPFDVSIGLISGIPDLLETTRKAALDYVRAEEERIAKILSEDN